MKVVENFIPLWRQSSIKYLIESRIMKEVIKTEEPSVEIVIPSDKIDYLQRELTNIREDFTDNKYVIEATKV